MTLRARVFALLFAVAPAAVSATARAQNPRDVPLGGRTAMMGGAATASGNDSAMPYLNPAGLALLPHDVLALSANVYGAVARNVDGFFHPDGYEREARIEEERFDGRSLLQLPSSLMYALHFGGKDAVRHTLALSVIIPSAERVNIGGAYSARVPSTSGSITDVRSTSYESTEYYLGGTYAVRLGKLRLGLSLFGVYDTWRDSSTTTFILEERSGAQLGQATQQNTSAGESFSIAPIAGAQLALGKFSLGLAVAAPSIQIAGRYEHSDDLALSQMNGRTVKQTGSEATSTYRSGQPLRVNAGISYEDPGRFALAADIVWFSSIGSEFSAAPVFHATLLVTDEIGRDVRVEAPFSGEANEAIDFSAGGEVWVSDAVALRGGVFTNLATQQLADTAYENIYSWVTDRAGGTLGLGFKAGSFDTTVGAVYQYGWGNYVTPSTDHRDAVLVGIEEHFMMVVVSGVVTLEDLL